MKIVVRYEKANVNRIALLVLFAMLLLLLELLRLILVHSDDNITYEHNIRHQRS